MYTHKVYRFLTTALIACATVPTQADDRTEGELRSAALSVLQSDTPALRRLPAHTATSLRMLRQTPTLTVMGYDDAGFAVMTNDSSFPAVVGYSTGRFADELQGCCFAEWLKASEAYFAQQKANGLPARRTTVPSDLQRTVDMLCQTKWNQHAPYNNLLHFKINNYNATMVTGCVATATAQILKFWNYPEKGFGSNSWTVSYPEYGNVNYTFSGSLENVYDWDNMLNQYGTYYDYDTQQWVTPSYSEAQGSAVAQLVRDCGYATSMKYHASASSAGVYNTTFSHYFSTFHGQDIVPSNYSEQQWADVMYREIAAGRPAITSGNNHVFILDGYDQNGLFHVNFGWGGSSDNFLDIYHTSYTTRGDVVGMAPPAVLGIRPIADPSELSNTKLYTIEASNYNNGTAFVASGAANVTICGGKNAYANRDIAYDKNDPRQQFAILQYDGKFYLYSVGARKFVSASSTGGTRFSNLPKDHVTFEPISGRNHCLRMKFNGTTRVRLTNSMETTTDNADTDWSQLRIMEVGDSDNAEALDRLSIVEHPHDLVPITTLDELNNETAYMLRNRAGLGYAVYRSGRTFKYAWLAGLTSTAYGEPRNEAFAEEVSPLLDGNNWLIIQKSGLTYLYSVGGNTFLTTAENKNYARLSDDAVPIIIGRASDGGFTFSTTGAEADLLTVNPTMTFPMGVVAGDEAQTSFDICANPNFEAEPEKALAKIAIHLTGVSATPQQGGHSAEAYDLQGRRVKGESLPAGVYVIGGKKVLVK